MKEKKMFTIKLRRNEEKMVRTESHSSILEGDPAQDTEVTYLRGTVLIEAKTVGIYLVRPNVLVELSGTTSTGEKFCFYVQNPQYALPPGEKNIGIGLPSDVEFWDEAYIENSSGATTEIVRF
jgi:hypothetical protein